MSNLQGNNNPFDNSDRNGAWLERAGKTASEVGLNFGKVALPAIALLGINYLNLPIAEDAKVSLTHLGSAIHQGLDFSFNLVSGSLPKVDLQNIKEIAINGGAFTTGLALGILNNLGSILTVLKNLDGKTESGNYEPSEPMQDDGTYVFQLSCVDKRRIDKSGIAVPGSFGIMGSEFIGFLAAMSAQGLRPDTIDGNFFSGLFLGNNILTEIYSHIGVWKEIKKISTDPRYKGHRIKIEMMDHDDGCGAEGFTNPLSYWLKFKKHQLKLADLAAIGNEVAGFIYVNGVLGPAVGIFSGGRISLSAVIKRSEMEQTH